MGPGQVDSLPNLPRFAWDRKIFPWIDGKGDEEEYSQPFKL